MRIWWPYVRNILKSLSRGSKDLHYFQRDPIYNVSSNLSRFPFSPVPMIWCLYSLPPISTLIKTSQTYGWLIERRLMMNAECWAVGEGDLDSFPSGTPKLKSAGVFSSGKGKLLFFHAINTLHVKIEATQGNSQLLSVTGATPDV